MTFEKTFTGGLSGFIGEKHAFSVKDTKTLLIDSNHLYGLEMSQSLTYAKITFANKKSHEELLSTTDNADSGYILEVGLRYTVQAKKES